MIKKAKYEVEFIEISANTEEISNFVKGQRYTFGISPMDSLTVTINQNLGNIGDFITKSKSGKISIVWRDVFLSEFDKLDD